MSIIKTLKFMLIAFGCLVATEASAARVLYAYADTSGQAVVKITDGLLAPWVYENVTADLCLRAGAICSKARFSGSPGDATFLPINVANGSIGPGYYFDTDFSKPGLYSRVNSPASGQLLIAELKNSNAVYVYADTGGQAVVKITDGLLAPWVYENVTADLCLRAEAICSKARFSGSPGDATFLPTNVANGSIGPGYYFGTDFSKPGLYDRVNSAASGQLLIVGPVANVPEPATWAMMISGFGLLGGVLRRRQHINFSRA